MQELNGRTIFVDYAKPRADFGGGMPIARGPPEPTADSWLPFMKILFVDLMSQHWMVAGEIVLLTRIIVLAGCYPYFL